MSIDMGHSRDERGESERSLGRPAVDGMSFEMVVVGSGVG